MAKVPPTLLEHAVAASENVQQLAVGLAHAGAVPDVVKQLGAINNILHQIIKALGQGPTLDNAAQNGPDAPPGPPQAQPDAAPASPQAGPPEPAQATTPSTAHPAAQHAMKAASQALMAAHAAANQPQPR